MTRMEQRKARIVARRSKGQSLAQIGQRFGITATRVWQILSR